MVTSPLARVSCLYLFLTHSEKILEIHPLKLKSLHRKKYSLEAYYGIFRKNSRIGELSLQKFIILKSHPILPGKA